jgi:hypothetical protein
MSEIIKATRKKTAIEGLNWSTHSFDVVGDALRPLLAKAEIEYEVFRAGVGLEVESLLKRTFKEDEVEYLKKALPDVVQNIAFQAASLGLVPGTSSTGRMCSAIVRYSKDSGNRWAIKGHAVLVQPEWRGVIFLMRKANPEIDLIKIQPICDGDVVGYDLLNDDITSHTTTNSDSRDATIELSNTGFALKNNQGGYIIVRFNGGAQRVLPLSKHDIIRSIGASDTMKLPYQGKPDKRSSSPWVVHTNPMIYKTMAHALYRKPDIWAGRASNSHYLEALAIGSKAINRADFNRVTSIEDRSSPIVAELLAITEEAGGDSDLVHRLALEMGCESVEDVINSGREAVLIDRIMVAVA